MKIAIDYDDTFTRDPKTWVSIINILKNNGHSVYGVSLRYDTEFERSDMHPDFFKYCDIVFLTGRELKHNYIYNTGIYIDVWVDDTPESIRNVKFT